MLPYAILKKKKSFFKNGIVFITVFLYIITFFCLIFYEIMILYYFLYVNDTVLTTT